MAERRLACNLITVERLRELLDYDPVTGILTWKRRAGNTRKINAWNGKNSGKTAGSLRPDGYIHISLYKKRYFAHRIAVCLSNNEWPNDYIDHWDLNRSNNKIENLRIASKSMNGSNRLAPKNNTSGYKGVYWCKILKKWVARIRANSNQMVIGSFISKEDAAAAYAKAASELFGEFARP